MIQFAILGTLGDIISKWIIQRRIFAPFDVETTLLKMVEWVSITLKTIEKPDIGFLYRPDINLLCL